MFLNIPQTWASLRGTMAGGEESALRAETARGLRRWLGNVRFRAFVISLYALFAPRILIFGAISWGATTNSRFLGFTAAS
jgi:hypothetical protein